VIGCHGCATLFGVGSGLDHRYVDMTSLAPALHIRLATPADAPAMARVLAEAFEAFRPLYTPDAFAATTPSAEVIAGRFGEGPMWVAEAQGAILGTASAVVRRTGLYVRSVGVLPAARGRRLGQALTPHLGRK
jgi:hypothetical protein